MVAFHVDGPHEKMIDLVERGETTCSLPTTERRISITNGPPEAEQTDFDGRDAESSNAGGSIDAMRIR